MDVPNAADNATTKTFKYRNVKLLIDAHTSFPTSLIIRHDRVTRTRSLKKRHVSLVGIHIAQIVLDVFKCSRTLDAQHPYSHILYLLILDRNDTPFLFVRKIHLFYYEYSSPLDGNLITPIHVQQFFLTMFMMKCILPYADQLGVNRSILRTRNFGH